VALGQCRSGRFAGYASNPARLAPRAPARLAGLRGNDWTAGREAAMRGAMAMAMATAIGGGIDPTWRRWRTGQEQESHPSKSHESKAALLAVFFDFVLAQSFLGKKRCLAPDFLLAFTTGETTFPTLAKSSGFRYPSTPCGWATQSVIPERSWRWSAAPTP
jgi:hypothetical protein